VVYSLTNWEVMYPVNVDDNVSDVLTLRSLVGKVLIHMGLTLHARFMKRKIHVCMQQVVCSVVR
jgi:hypothetical protein